MSEKHALWPQRLLIAAAGFAGATLVLADLPHLARLLPRLTLTESQAVPEDSPAMPHELARAAALGWRDRPAGCLPWAALDSATLDQPCAWLSATHWQVGMKAVQVLPPSALALSAAEAAQLQAALAQWLAQDGLTLHPATSAAAQTAAPPPPGTWLVSGALLRGLSTVSIDRIAGRAASRDWLKQPPAIARLLNELQMLLHQHPLTDARLAAGRLSANGVWLHGAGQLAALPPQPGPLCVTQALAAAQAGDANAHRQALQAIDRLHLAPLHEALQRGHAASLTLAGTRRWLRLESHTPGLWPRLKRLAAPAPAPTLLHTL